MKASEKKKRKDDTGRWYTVGTCKGNLATWTDHVSCRCLVRPSSAFFSLVLGDGRNRRTLIIKSQSAANMTSLLSPLLSGLDLDKDEYIGLLTKLIGESVHVQNNPRQGLVS